MSVATRDVIERRVLDAFVEFGADRERLVPEATLEELDLDSLDLFELGQILKQEFEIEVDPEEFEGVRTLGDAHEVLYRHVP